MQKSSKNNAFALIAQVVLLIIIYSLICYLIRGINLQYSIPQFLFVFLIAFLLVTNIHEFGHFVFGKLLGYNLIIYQFSVFAWVYENGKLKFSLRKAKGYSGYCVMVPYKEVPLYKQALYYAGGIIFNFITGGIFVLLLILIPTLPDLLILTLIQLSGISLYFGLTNFMRFYSGSNASDGMLLWNIILKKRLGKGF